MSFLCKELEFKHTKKLAFFKGMHNSVGENFHPPEKIAAFVNSYNK